MSQIQRLIASGDLAAAQTFLKKNISSFNKRDRLFWQAIIYQVLKETKYAEKYYKELLTLYPQDQAAAINLAVLLNSQQRYQDAVKVLEEIPLIVHQSALLALFDAQFGLKDYKKAYDVIQTFSNDSRGKVEYLERYAALLMETGEIEKSIEILEHLMPHYEKLRPSILGNLSAARNRLGDHELALDYANRAIANDPKKWQFQLNKTNALMGLDRLEEAEIILTELVSRGINSPEIFGNLARIKNVNGEIDSSITLCKNALAERPNFVSVLCCLADNYSCLGNTQEANRVYRRALALDENDDLTNWHYALSLLRDSNFDEGWKQYRWGFKRKKNGRGPYIADRSKEWDGSESCTSLLIWGEQGIGDQIMFFKFLKYLPESIREIYVKFDERLLDSLKNRTLIQKAITFSSSDIPQTQAQVPVGNLTCHLWKKYEQDQTRSSPFLRRIQINTTGRLRIGVCWRGGITERMQKKRSFPLGLFKRIKALRNEATQLVCLQYNALNEEITYLKTVFGDDLSIPKYDPIKRVDLWIDHIDSCDLIISADNSCVHFSGALGIPTLVLLPFHPDFRWERNGSSTHWYQSLTLLRNANQLSIDELASQVDNWLDLNSILTI